MLSHAPILLDTLLILHSQSPHLVVVHVMGLLGPGLEFTATLLLRLTYIHTYVCAWCSVVCGLVPVAYSSTGVGECGARWTVNRERGFAFAIRSTCRRITMYVTIHIRYVCRYIRNVLECELCVQSAIN